MTAGWHQRAWIRFCNWLSVWHHRGTGKFGLGPDNLGVIVMDPRKLGAWAGRLLLSAGLALAVILGAGGTTQASDVQSSTEVSGASTNLEPGWG